ncbi:hypothetical protein BGX29_004758 [Mortierella sp. GBA35]|nr:hypothetical protein BGX29_004758 [Mortierella sp. GBA35]
MAYPSSTHRDRALQLPEVLESVGSFMDPPTLLSWVQVCRLWNEALLPSLWHTIDDDLYQWPDILLNYDSEEAQGNKDEAWFYYIFNKHGHLIRHLQVRCRVLVWAANTSGTCGRLKSLGVSVIKKTSREATRSQRAFGLTIEEGGRTRQEQLASAVKGPLLSPIFQDALAPARVGIRTVAQQETDWMTAQYCWLLVRQNPAVRTLSLDWTLDLLCTLRDSHFVCNTMGLLPRLESPTFFANNFNLNLLLGLPGLRHFCHSSPSIFDTLLDRPIPHLESIEIKGFVTLHSLVALLRYLPNLKQFRVAKLYGPLLRDQDSTHTLQGVQCRLKEFCVVRRGAADDKILTTLLPFMTELTHFTTERLIRETTALALSHQISQHPWECGRLETFRCQIDGFQPFTEREQAALDLILASELVPDDNKLEEYQQDVMEKYRRRQEEYRVTREDCPFVEVDGVTYVQYSGPIPQTLKLSLASGLDRLSSLKDLEVFGFEGSTIDDERNRWPTILASHDDESKHQDWDKDSIQHVFAKYLPHTRHLRLSWNTTIGLQLAARIAPDCGNRPKAQQEEDWMAVQHSWLLIRQNPGLQKLNVDQGRAKMTGPRALPMLEYLNNSAVNVDFTMLLERLPHLQYCHCGNETFKMVLRKSFTGLRTDNKPFCRDGAAILESRPSRLKDFRLAALVDEDAELLCEDISRFLAPWVPELTHICLPLLTLSIASHLVACCSKIRYILPTSSMDFTIGSVSNIRDQSKAFVTLFHGLSSLTSFSCSTFRVKVDILMQHSWSCPELEDEQVVLDELVPSGTEESSWSDQERHIMDKHHHCRDRHHQMYDRLAACSRLRILDLGIVPHYVFGGEGDEGGMDAAVETMEPTLDSGLDRLARLVCLEEFRCSMLDQESHKRSTMVYKRIKTLRPGIEHKISIGPGGLRVFWE